MYGNPTPAQASYSITTDKDVYNPGEIVPVSASTTGFTAGRRVIVNGVDIISWCNLFWPCSGSGSFNASSVPGVHSIVAEGYSYHLLGI
jgi:hypothetical protein